MLGFVLASMVSTAANAHGRAKDGHHDRARIVSVSRVAMPAGQAVAPRVEQRESPSPPDDLESTAAGGSALNEVVQRAVVPADPVAGDVPDVRADHLDGAKAGIPRRNALMVAPSLSWDAHQTIVTARSDWPVGCCADGLGCCCQGASACGSCGMTCCASAMAALRDSGVARDHSRCRLYMFASINHDGINLGPADRPPAVRT